MREYGFDNFVHLMHLLRENSETNFGKQLKLVAMNRCWPELQGIQKSLQLLPCKWIVTLDLECCLVQLNNMSLVGNPELPDNFSVKT